MKPVPPHLRQVTEAGQVSQKNERKLTGLMVAMCKIRAKWPKMLQSAPILLICSDGQLKDWTGTNYCKASTRVCVEGKLRHILRYRAHFSPSCKKSVFLKITWKQPLKAYIYSKCIYFAYQLTYLKFWMHLDTFQAKLGWLDQQKYPFFSRLAASRQSSW